MEPDFGLHLYGYGIPWGSTGLLFARIIAIGNFLHFSFRIKESKKKLEELDFGYIELGEKGQDKLRMDGEKLFKGFR